MLNKTDNNGFAMFMSDTNKFPSVFDQLTTHQCGDKYKQYVKCANANLFIEILGKTKTVIAEVIRSK